MCGRFTLRSTRKELADFFGVLFPDLPPRYNLAPTQDVPAIRSAGVGRVVPPSDAIGAQSLAVLARL
jgi:putative SOS response-associated peptidase YedK